MRAKTPRAAMWRWLGFLFCLGVLVLAMIPNPADAGGHGMDKVLHASAFACLGGWFGALSATHRRLLMAAIGLALFGAGIELVQGLSGYRDAEWLDLAADVVGIVLGLVLLRSLMARSLRYIEGRVRPAGD